MIAYTSLEWCLNSPPKPHGFASLCIQCGLTQKKKKTKEKKILLA